MKVTLELPEGQFVSFSESGAKQPNRLILQFKNLSDMQLAQDSLCKSINKITQDYADRRVDSMQIG